MIEITFCPTIITQALVDTASSRTIMSREFFNKIKSLSCVKSISKINQSILTAGNNRITVRQEATIHFKINQFSWNFSFWICNQIPYDTILGFDFLKHSQMICDIGKGMIGFKFSDQEVSCLLTEVHTQSDDITLEESNLTQTQQNILQGIISEFRDVLTKEIGRANCPPYEIKVKGSPAPVQTRPYQCNPERMKALKSIVENMLRQQIIEPSSSQWCSPAFVVPKRDKNEYRMVCDFRKVNQYIELDLFPTPHIENLFEYMADASYFTSFDLVEAYHQIPISDDSKQYTAFATPFGYYQYRTIPQGIKIGSQALARITQTVLSDLQYDCVLTFADDLVIYSNTAEAHIKHVREVLSRLREANLTVNPNKISLAKNGVHFLGFIVKNGKLFIDPSRTEAIRTYPTPKTIKHVQRFLGMVAFFGKFLENVAQVSAPLNRLKRKGVKFRWGETEMKSFELLKKMMTTPPALHLPDYTKKFILYTDASEHALGASLGQMHNGVWAPIAYASRTLSATEAAYSVYRKEVLGAVWGCERFKHILADHPFILRSDNEALTQVLKTERKIGQFARWKLRLSEFQFEIEHVRSSANLCADALSRMFEISSDSKGQVLSANKESNVVKAEECHILHSFPECFEDLAQSQRKDPTLGPIITRLERKIQVPNYELRAGILKYRKNVRCAPKIVVPRNMQTMVTRYNHDAVTSAHLGIKKTIAKIAREFAWEGMFQFVRDYVKSCDICQKSKQAQNQQYGLMLSRPAENNFDRVYCDLFGPLTRSKRMNSYIFVAVDSFSKFVFMRPLRKATSASVIKELRDNIFSQHGLPRTIVTDSGSQFTSSQFKSFLFGLGVKHVTTSVAHPQANRSERNNKNLKVALKIFHSEAQTTWDVHLPYLSLAFNTAPHEGHKRTPCSVFLGRELHHPLKLHWNIDDDMKETGNDREQVLKDIARELKATHEKTKKRYDKNRKPSPFVVNDLVLYRRFIHSNKAKQISHKMTQVWRGPFVVTEVLSPVNVKIQLVSDQNYNKVVHVSQLKRYYQRQDR